MATADRHYDVIIAGGGMIGSCTALALAPLGLRIAVIERTAPDAQQQPSFDERSTAVSRSSQRLFTALGLWPDIAAAAAPILAVHVSDRGRYGFAHIDAREQRVEALGYAVVNRVLGDVLRYAIGRAAGADVLCPAEAGIPFIEGERIGIDVCHSAGADRLSASLLIAADGARSAMRDAVGIGSRSRDYGQVAITGNVETELPLDGRAFERFTSGGPLALLPLIGERAGFVWTVPTTDAGHLLALDDAAFRERLQDVFGQRLGRFGRIGSRAAYPLALSRALRLTAPRSVLVGNAAHGLHPVAAQGFNLGLRDVATLADCVADAWRDGGDIGATPVLDRYARWRREDQGKLVRLTDGLVRLFVDNRPPVRLLRSLGMLAFDLVPGVRREFARHTMGLTGRLPRLSRGLLPE